MSRIASLFAVVLLLHAGPAVHAAETLHFVIMVPTAPAKEAAKYEVLSAYLRAANPLLGDIKLRIAKDFPEAVRLFKEGDVEGMFSASFVAAVFIAKGLARPVARPLRTDGGSTYGAAIVAKEGTKPFGGLGDIKGKRVAYCPLASAGEVYLRSLLPAGEKPEGVFTPVPVATHQAALQAVTDGAADYAFVKSTVFSPGQYAGLALVGSDAGGNPDNTLIMPPAAHQRVGGLITRALLALEADTGEKATAAKRAFGCRAFIPTTGMDFAPTFSLMVKARVDPKTFDFAF